MGTTFKETKIGQIPADWKLVKFEDIGVTYGGLTNKNKEDFGKGKPYIPFLNIMNNAKIDLDYFDYVDVQEGEKQNRAKKGDLFFNTSSETPEEVGMCSVLCDDVPELYLNSFCFGFRIEDQNSLLPLFVSYFFRSGVGRKVIFPLAQGMTRYNLSKRYFLQLEIPKPKTEEQRKIAEIFSIVDETIEKTEAVIQETQQLKNGLMQKLFTEGIGHTRFKETKIGRIPEEWEIERLERFCQRICVGFVGTCEKFYTNEDVGVKMLRTGNLREGHLVLNDLKYVTKEFHSKNQKSQLADGDLVIARHGTSGQSVLIPEGFGEANCLNIVIVRADRECFLPRFLNYLFNSNLIRRQIDRNKAGSTQEVINTKEIAKTLFLRPSMLEQKRIAQILSEVDAKIETEQAFKAELERLKKGLMQVLLTGKVRVKV